PASRRWGTGCGPGWWSCAQSRAGPRAERSRPDPGRRHDVAPPGVRPRWRSPSVGVMNDKEILSHIDELIATEHDLRTKVASGELSSAAERDQLRSVEEALDQCWDLLRQRRAPRGVWARPPRAAGPPAPGRGRG